MSTKTRSHRVPNVPATRKVGPKGKSAGASPRHPGFGALVRQCREHAKPPMLQKDLAKALGCKQSFVAQIEKGDLANISGQLVANIARACGVRPERLVAQAIRETYGIAAAKAALLDDDVLSLDELADWERNVDAEDLWIVTPQFVDREHEGIRNAVIHRLQRGTTVTFIVPEHACDELGDFTHYRDQLRQQLGDEEFARLKHYPISRKDQRFLTSSFVIADPPSLYKGARTPGRTSGYVIVLRENPDQPQQRRATAFRLSEPDLLAKARGIHNWLKENGHLPKS